MYFCSVHSLLHCISVKKHISSYDKEGTKKAAGFRGQLNDGLYRKSVDCGRRRTIHRKNLSACLYIWVPTSSRTVFLNLTDQTDQTENRASPVNSEDYGNGGLATNHFGRQQTQEGLSLSRFHFIVKCF